MKLFSGWLLATLILAGPAAAADGDTLRIAVSALPTQRAHPFQSALSPTITTNGAMYDGLTRYSRDGTIEPWLAVAWDHTDDLTWRFTLRDNVTFSNGVPLTAESVVAVVEHLNTAARPFDNIVRDLPKLTSARALDARTVEIVTAEPMPLFPRYAMLLLVPEMGAFAALGQDGFTNAPVGTGPYKATDWGAARVKFEAFEQSWRKPKIPNLEIIAVQDPANRVHAVIAGQADIAIGLGLEQAGDMKAAGGVVQSWANDTVGAIALVTTRPTPFTDIRVRRALNLAIDRATIAATLFDGTVTPATQPAARGMFGFNPDLPSIPYDPARAKALLAEAGYSDGFSFVMDMTTVIGTDATLYQQIAADFAKLGVHMELRMLPPAQYLRNAFGTGEYDDALTVPWAGVPVGDVMRAVKMHSCAHNVPWTCDSSIMPLIEAINREWDEAKALEMRRQLMRYYREEMPAIFLFESVLYTGTTKRVRGFQDYFGFVPYERISFSGD
ncbi:MAG: ABC transporter substrate-binding protein [Rhodobacteraceae bacterium]|nr:ABC transporter substrate-binding protein [Paracoccaceae bacterium]